MRSLLIAGLLACAGVAAHGQAVQERPPQDTSAPSNRAAPSANEDDITVNGRLTEESRKSPLPGSVARTSRDAATDAHQFVRCLNGIAPGIQRRIVEGHAQDPQTQDALDTLIQKNAACYPHLFRPQLDMTAGYFGACNPLQAGIRAGQTNAEAKMGSITSSVQIDMSLCRAAYDRGAIIEEAFRTYAPHFMLTRADTLNRDVVDRFRAREKIRGKHRSPMDRRYYNAVSCMVQLEPEKAVRLLRTDPGGGDETALRMLILDRTGRCTGNAKTVKVDPPQFRGYLADALYHWSIAAKNVDTLVPST
ncbi:MAG: hypothetical protein EOP61_01760 [Sphingomonadales bacterium]|nr:MAG: hypothetical protein EOP61_01760 [Sphingomonadales bacterium]